MMLLASACNVAKVNGTFPSEKTTSKAMLSALKWQEAHPIFEKNTRDWTNGAYYMGVTRAHKATQRQEYFDALLEIGRKNNWQMGERFYHADDLPIGNVYLYLNALGVREADIKPTGAMIQKHLYEPHEWREGTAGKEQVILWWWCDALFMAPPLIARYSRLTGNNKNLEEMHKYYLQTYNLLYDKEEKLFARDTRFVWTGIASDRKEVNGKKIFWARGNGWVLAGLALLLDDLPMNNVHRPFYENLFKDMSAKIAGLQQEDGMWHTSLLAPESFPHGESSGTGFFTFAMAWGINHNLLDAAIYKPVVQKAWKALLDCQQKNGQVGWVQNIGADPQPSDAGSWQNFGTGAFLMAGSEIMMMK